MGQMLADDMDLVREFATSGSEAVFAALVHRHVNLVYSAALRQLFRAVSLTETKTIQRLIGCRKYPVRFPHRRTYNQ